MAESLVQNVQLLEAKCLFLRVIQVAVENFKEIASCRIQCGELISGDITRLCVTDNVILDTTEEKYSVCLFPIAQLGSAVKVETIEHGALGRRSRGWSFLKLSSIGNLQMNVKHRAKRPIVTKQELDRMDDTIHICDDEDESITFEFWLGFPEASHWARYAIPLSRSISESHSRLVLDDTESTPQFPSRASTSSLLEEQHNERQVTKGSFIDRLMMKMCGNTSENEDTQFFDLPSPDFRRSTTNSRADTRPRRKLSSRKSSSSRYSTPKICIENYCESTTAVCRIDIIKARNLRALDTDGTSDPYVEVCIQRAAKSIGTVHRTKYIANTLTPEWKTEAEFALLVPPPYDEHVLSVRVLDFDYGELADDVIGDLEIPIDSLFEFDTETALSPHDECSTTSDIDAIWYKLKSPDDPLESGGEILLRIWLDETYFDIGSRPFRLDPQVDLRLGLHTVEFFNEIIGPVVTLIHFDTTWTRINGLVNYKRDSKKFQFGIDDVLWLQAPVREAASPISIAFFDAGRTWHMVGLIRLRVSGMSIGRHYSRRVKLAACDQDGNFTFGGILDLKTYISERRPIALLRHYVSTPIKPHCFVWRPLPQHDLTRLRNARHEFVSTSLASLSSVPRAAISQIISDKGHVWGASLAADSRLLRSTVARLNDLTERVEAVKRRWDDISKWRQPQRTLLVLSTCLFIVWHPRLAVPSLLLAAATVSLSFLWDREEAHIDVTVDDTALNDQESNSCLNDQAAARSPKKENTVTNQQEAIPVPAQTINVGEVTTGTVLNPFAKMQRQYHTLLDLCDDMENLVDDSITYIEQVLAAITWAEPRVSTAFVALNVLAALFLVLASAFVIKLMLTLLLMAVFWPPPRRHGAAHPPPVNPPSAIESMLSRVPTRSDRLLL